MCSLKILEMDRGQERESQDEATCVMFPVRESMGYLRDQKKWFGLRRKIDGGVQVLAK